MSNVISPNLVRAYVPSRSLPVNQNIRPEEPVLDLVSLKGGVPLASGSYARQLQSASEAGAGQAAGAAMGGLPALVLTYFSAEEWAQLNPGHYHDQFHPVHVAETVAGVAANLGRPAERVQFLQQVALLHDVDERVDLSSGAQNSVSPARVPVTLEWMDRNESALNQRMGWSHEDFREAKALIARTDFPYDSRPKTLGTRYDGNSPVALYADMVGDLPEERRQRVAEDALLLRFADQTGNYTVSREQSRDYIQGLADEMANVGNAVPFVVLAKGSPSFLSTAGTDLDNDWQLAGALHLDAGRFAGREALLQAMPQQQRQALEETQTKGVLNL